MIPDGIKDRFVFYRKWFKTFLIKEFMNLPLKYQDQFLVILTDFTVSCKKIREECNSINEKMIQLTVTDVDLCNKEEKCIIRAKSPEIKNEVSFLLAISNNIPKIGSKLNYTVYSIDKNNWYSSREELMKFGIK